MFNDCKDAEKYNNAEEDGDFEDATGDGANADKQQILLTNQKVTDEKTKQNTENNTQRITTKLFKLQKHIWMKSLFVCLLSNRSNIVNVFIYLFNEKFKLHNEIQKKKIV